MNPQRQLVLVVVCLVCVLAVASMLPAADPRIDAGDVGHADSETSDWEGVVGGEEQTVSSETELDENGGDEDRQDGDGSESAQEPGFEDDSSDDFTLYIDEQVAAGNRVTLKSDSVLRIHSYDVYIDGDFAGEFTSPDVGETAELSVTVPTAEQMTISVPDNDYSRTVDIDTTATITSTDPPAPDQLFSIEVTIGDQPLRDATVYQDGEVIGHTNRGGEATIRLPETAESTDIRVERDIIEGSVTVDVKGPEMSFNSPFIFPGLPTTLEVTAGGEPVSDANVTINNETTVVTDSDGEASITVPLSDELTATVSLGEETASTAVSDLYLRLAAVIIFVPGLFIGAIVSYYRLIPEADEQELENTSANFFSIAVLLSGLAAVLANIRVSFKFHSLTAPKPGQWLTGLTDRFAFPRLPALSLGVGSLPSLGTLFSGSNNSSARSTGILSSIGDLIGGDESKEPETDDSDANPKGTELNEPRPVESRIEIRQAWHEFCTRLGVRNRETRTAGEVARQAIETGFPASSVRRFVALFRGIEYGGEDPTQEDVTRAQKLAANLEITDTEDEESE